MISRCFRTLSCCIGPWEKKCSIHGGALTWIAKGDEEKKEATRIQNDVYIVMAKKISTEDEKHERLKKDVQKDREESLGRKKGRVGGSKRGDKVKVLRHVPDPLNFMHCEKYLYDRLIAGTVHFYKYINNNQLKSALCNCKMFRVINIPGNHDFS